MEKILRVNMSRLSISCEAVPESYLSLGGRSLTARILMNEVKPTCDPLGFHNKLVLTPGLLAGTAVSTSSRLSVGAKSPLTGGIKESNAGGNMSAKLARLGYKAVIIEGKAEGGPYLLKLGPGQTDLVRCPDLRGRGNYEAAGMIRQAYGEGAAVMTVGPAGEMRLSAAAIAHIDRDGITSRFNGRGGLGAVMGAKGLKAVVVDDAGADPSLLYDPAAFKEAARRFVKLLLSHPRTSEELPTYGTLININIVNEAGGLPTHNFSRGRFDQAEGVSGERMQRISLQALGRTSHGCQKGCVIRCAHYFPDGGSVISAPEYESACLLGPNCGIPDLAAVARMNRFCNDIGVDTIETGASLGVAMEGGLLAFGDAEGALDLIAQIGRGTVVGRLIGSGAVITGRVIGVSRVPAVKGQSMAGYDPRAFKGTGVTYATSPMGADHTAGNFFRSMIDHQNPEGMADRSRDAQLTVAGFDSTGLCGMVRPALQDDGLLADLINYRYGWTLGRDFLARLGEMTLRLERLFNTSAGMGREHDRLPEFFSEEKIDPHRTVFDVSEQDLDSVHGPLDSGDIREG